ncbi:MAG: type II secretion system protein [Phycisphaerae bacterium]
MKRILRSGREAFTLVELLTVVAIIGLLIGILVPALSAARNQAKEASTKAQLDSIGKGCLMFSSDNSKLPASGGNNPFVAAGAYSNLGPTLTGTQWLVVQLVGPDRQGYVKNDLSNDHDADGRITATDWNAWYELPGASGYSGKKYSRATPYVDPDGKNYQTLAQFVEDNSLSDDEIANLPAQLANGLDTPDVEWSSARVPYFIDAFKGPILYYAATAGAEAPFSTGQGSNRSLKIGLYDQSDNAAITGSEVRVGRWDRAQSVGFDFRGSGWSNDPDAVPNAHFMARLGWDADEPNKWPVQRSFARTLADRSIYDTTKRGTGAAEEGRIAPRNPDTFVMVSAGRDGLFGTDDDITNFNK